MLKKYSFVVSDIEAGERLDVFLSEKLKEITRSQMKKYIYQQKVFVNGEARKPSYKVRPGDRVEGEREVEENIELQPENIPLNIIFSDENLIVLEKPPGLVVHPGAGNLRGTLVNALLYHFPEIAGLGHPERPGIVHRLDKEASGLMVVARSHDAYRELKRQFKSREIDKVYLGLVWGRMPEREGKFTWALGRHRKHREKISVKTARPKEAMTYYSVRKEYKDFTLLEIKPVTGRTHQIRVHFSTAGHPLAGDKLYGRVKAKKYRFPRLFLHAHRLAFVYPGTRRWVEFYSALPKDLEEVLHQVASSSS